MSHRCQFGRLMIVIGLTILVMFGCSRSPAPVDAPAATPTPTEPAGILLPTEEETNRCAGLAGNLEVQILVGPSEAVGMEPLALGIVPFSVIAQEGVYSIEGGGPISFEEQVYEEAWGTYTVNFDADSQISGSCEPLDDGGVLNLIFIMTGEQMVVVDSEGFYGEYPWSGTQEIRANFPVEEGVSHSGEGWTLVLHLAP